MDLGLYFRVIWRFRVVVAIGLLLAIILALLSFVSLSFAGGKPHFSYRQAQKWETQARLFVTQSGFPWGRTTLQYLPSTSETPPVPAADVNRLSSLAILYANIATSDPVLRLMKRRPNPSTASISVAPVPAPAFSSPPTLPLIDIKVDAYSASGAVAYAKDITRALVTYIERLQASNAIPVSDRVMIQVIKRPDTAVLIGPRGKTMPVVVFLAVLAATIGLVFVLENLRPRVRPVLVHAVAEPVEQSATRRSS